MFNKKKTEVDTARDFFKKITKEVHSKYDSTIERKSTYMSIAESLILYVMAESCLDPSQEGCEKKFDEKFGDITRLIKKSMLDMNASINKKFK